LIPLDKEEEHLTVCLEEMFKTNLEFKSIKMVCIAAAYLQRFYLEESVFVYNPQEMLYACLYIAQKIEEIGYSFEHFCRSLR
jgi:hypothetical protein